MKITINDEEIMSLSDIQKAVIKNDILEDIFESDMHRRLHYIIDYSCRRCVEHHTEIWKQRLNEQGIAQVPTCHKRFADLIFSLKDLPIEDEEKGEISVKVDGKEIFTISETEKKLIKIEKYDHNVNEFIKEKLIWILNERYKVSMKSLRYEWEPIFISEGATSLPVSDDDFAVLVFSHSNYKSRTDREKILEVEYAKRRAAMAKDKKGPQIPATDPKALGKQAFQSIPEVCAEKPTFLKQLFSRGE